MTLAVVSRTPVPRAQGVLKRGRAAKAAKSASPAKAPVAVKVTNAVAPVVAAKTKTPVVHPTYAKMVQEALKHLQDRKGSSRQAILKYIMANFTVGNDQKPVNNHLKKALVGGTKNGSLKNVGQGKGASGLFKLPEKLAQEAAALKAAVPAARKRTAEPQSGAPQAKKAKMAKDRAQSAKPAPAKTEKKTKGAIKVTATAPVQSTTVEARQATPEPASAVEQVAPKKRWGQRQQTQPTAAASKAPARSGKSANPESAEPAKESPAAPANPPRSRAKPAQPKPAAKATQARGRGKRAAQPEERPKATEAAEVSAPAPVQQRSRGKVAQEQTQPQRPRSQARRGAQEAQVQAPQTAALPQSTGLFGREAVNGSAIQSPAMKAIRRSRWGQAPADDNQNQENQGPVFGPAPKPADYVEPAEENNQGPVYGPAPCPAGYTEAA